MHVHNNWRSCIYLLIHC